MSGLSGSGKSIALKVLEDAGYYCVDNLPATLLLEVADFLALEAHHERIAVSVMRAAPRFRHCRRTSSASRRAVSIAA